MNQFQLSTKFSNKSCISVLYCQASWCSSKPLQCITRENNFKSFPLFRGNKFSQHKYYLGGRIHRGASSQQLLNQAHVTLLGSQVESIESILKEKQTRLQKWNNGCEQQLISMHGSNPETRQTWLYFFFLHQLEIRQTDEFPVLVIHRGKEVNIHQKCGFGNFIPADIFFFKLRKYLNNFLMRKKKRRKRATLYHLLHQPEIKFFPVSRTQSLNKSYFLTNGKEMSFS